MTTYTLPRGYELERVLKERDGVAVVLARPAAGRAFVVAKIVGPEASERTRNLFLDDIRLRAEHVHPGISPVQDSGRLPSGAIYAVSPYVRTTDPKRWVRQEPKTRSVALASRLAEPIAFLHGRGLIHGDIKPGNVLFRADREGIRELCVTDLLPRTFRRESAFGMLTGTPAYLAPEVFRGDDPDHRADLYSLGATLYEFFAGRPLFSGTAVDLAKAHLAAPARARFPARSGVPPAIWDAVARLLEKEPSDRPASVEEFLREVRGRPGRRPRASPSGVQPFVRRLELERSFRSWLEQERRPCLVISGLPGSGRTRFLQRFVGELRLEGRPVVAIAPEGTRPRPFDGARALFRAVSDEPLSLRAFAVGRTREREVPHLLAASREEVRLFRRLREAWERRLARFAPDESRPPIVVIDDADSLDDASSRFLSFLVARGGGGAVRYVLVRRNDGGPDAGRLFADLETRALARVEPVAPFGREEVASWLRGFLGPGKLAPELVETAARLSGGNPRRLDALVREWADRGSVQERRGVFRLHGRRPDGLVLLPDPGDLSTRGLTAGALELAGAVALVVHAKEARFFERLLSIPPHEFPGLVAPLVERRMVRREGRPGGDTYAPFSEELRGPLLGLLPANLRKSLHRTAARLAERAAADGEPMALAEAAEHWEQAGRPSSAGRALLHAASALEELSLFGEAAELIRNALRIKDGIRAPLERGRALLALAGLHQRVGEPLAALASLRLLHRTVRGEPHGEALARSATRLAAWIRYFRGKAGDAERLLLRLLEDRSISDPKEEAAVRCDLGWFALSGGHSRKAREHLGCALRLLRGCKAPVLKGRVLNRLGAVAFYESDWRGAGAYHERAARLLERAASPESVGALANLALVRLWTGSLSEARGLLEKARESAREGGEVLEEARITEDLARVLFRLGNGEEAARALEEASSVYEDFGDEGGKARVALSRGQMARERGLLDQSLESLRKGLALARSGANPFALFDALNLLALTHIARAEPSPAGAALDEAAAVLGDRLKGRYEALLDRSRARLAFLSGAQEEAERGFDRAARRFLERGERVMYAETLLLAAQARMDGPTMEPDDPSLARAEKLLAGMESPWFTLRLNLLLGRREEVRGDSAAAAARYRDAVRAARALHARLDLAEALARLGTLNARQGEKRRGRGLIEEASSLYDLVRIAAPPLLVEARALLQGGEEEGGEGFRSLCRIAGIINSLRDSGAILEHVLDQALDHLRAERGLILVRGPRGELVPRAARSLEETDLDDVTRFSRTLFRKAEESEEPLVADNALADPRFEGAESISAYNILSVACAPLRSKGRPLGLVYLDNCRTSNVFSRRDTSFLQALADLAGVALENARLLEDLQRENSLLREEVERRAEVPEIVAESPAMQRTMQQLRAAARSEISVLLLGETGSGKGLAAHLIHRESSRRDQPFLRLNCSAVVPTLVEDALFGHEVGAFTDAGERKAGIFERAHMGTLLLDEIGDMPRAAQAKLLRVLQDGEFERLGGVETLHANVRILAATNRDLADLVGRGEFRSDLYWRLNGVAIEIPSLRARREDIPALARAFLLLHSRRNRKDVRTISGAADGLLRSYDWPGNVRELDHVIERAVVFCDGRRIEPAHLTEEVRKAFPNAARAGETHEEETRDLPVELRGMESEILRQALVQTGWNKSKAARLLGIHESTVRKKIRIFRLDRLGPGKKPPKKASYVRTKR